jgi:hypothetical protein
MASSDDGFNHEPGQHGDDLGDRLRGRRSDVPAYEEEDCLDDLARLRRLLQWCEERNFDPRDVIEGRVLIALPPELMPGERDRSVLRRRGHRPTKPLQ